MLPGIQLCVHHVNNYQSSLLMFHVRLVCTFIIRRITRVVYEAVKENAWLCEATEIDREERLRRQREQYRVRRLRETVKERGQIG